MVAVNPNNIRWAREAMNLGIEDAANKLGLTSSNKSSAAYKLRELERGNSPPTQRQLENMARIYRIPVAAFYLDSIPCESDVGEDFRTLPERSSNTQANRHLQTLTSNIKARQSITRDLLEEEDSEPLEFVGSTSITADQQLVADGIMHAIGFDLQQYRRRPSDPGEGFKYLRDCIQNAGIFVLLLSDLGHPATNTIPVEVFRGFALVDDIAPYIVINRKDTKVAQSFTALHEVAHIWLGSSGISGKLNSRSAEVERFCNEVAARILLPREELQEFRASRSISAKTLLAKVAEFAKTRVISSSLVAYNLLLEQYIVQDTWLQIQRLLDTARAAQEQVDADTRAQQKELRIDNNRIKRFALGENLLNLAERSLAAGNLTPTKASMLLGVSPRKVRSFLNPGRLSREV